MDYRIFRRRRVAHGLARRALAGLAIVITMALGPAVSLRAQPPATTAAQDGFVPLDESKVTERLPSAPIVMTAYSVAWVVVFAYVWSLWSRLSRVEREMRDVSRRIEASARR